MQKTVTLTSDQQKYVRENKGRIPLWKIARHLSISETRLKNNLHAMGLCRKFKKRVHLSGVQEGYFDVNSFGKLYSF